MYVLVLLAASPLLSGASAKVFGRCELAEELLKHRVPEEQLATWLCIADRESNFNTSAVGRLNGDGSSDHGIFQISDKFWCSPGGWACGVDCASLRDDDIADDWKCVRRIYKEHQHLSGDGFNAWAVYASYCKSSTVSDYLNGCFKTRIVPSTFPATTLPGTTFPSSKFPATTFPATRFPSTTFPGTTFPSTKFPATTFPSTKFPAPKFPATTFPATTFPATTFHSTKFPATTFPATKFPATTFPATFPTATLGASDGTTITEQDHINNNQA